MQKRDQLPSLALVLPAVIIVTACACGTTIYTIPGEVGPPRNLTVNQLKDGDRLPADCELSLLVTREAEDPAEVPAGAEIASGSTVRWHTLPQCLKTSGNPLQPVDPQNLFIHGDDNEHDNTYPLRGVCTPGREKSECQWNGVFRHAAPPTFALHAVKGVLGDYVALVRVFRNGELVFSWAAGTTAEKDLLVAGKGLTGHLEPFMAPIDLRILPAGAELPPDALSTRIATAQSPWVTRFDVALKALAQDSTVKALGADYACLEWLARKAISDARAMSGQSVTAPAGDQPPNCEGAKEVPLPYDKIRKVLTGTARNLNDTVDAQIELLGASYGPLIENAAAKAKKELIKRGTNAPLASGKTVGETIGQIDELARSASDAFNQAFQLVDKARNEARTLAADRQRQAQAFANVAAALDAKGSVFQPVRTNPALANGEVALAMKYADPFQWFGLAVWHTITVRMAGNQGVNDFGLANAIPAIDLVGFRYNLGTGFRNIRVGVGALYFKDQQQAAAGQTDSKDVFHVAGQLNVGVSAFNVGLGAVADGSSVEFPNFKDRMRLLVGVDLLKAFTSQPAEAL